METEPFHLTENRTAADPEVSIIVVSWNTRDITLDCLRSVIQQTVGISYELIVVDNASTDSSPEAIAEVAPDAHLIALDENIGFARANNLAARQASGKYLLLLNPDTVVLDNAVTRLVEFANCCPDAGIWGGRTLFADATLNPASCWARMTLWNQFCRASGLAALFPRSDFFNGEAYGGWARDSVRRVDIVSGCFLLIERGLWQKLGGFDPSLFMYGEDADLCMRAAHLGAAPMITPAAQIVHFGGASEKARSGKLIRLLTAKATLLRRHCPAPTRWLGIALLQAWPATRLIALRVLKALSGAASGDDAAEAWRIVMAARRTWRQGYPSARSHSTASVLATG